MVAIDELFKVMIQYKASDLHISSGSPPYIRLNGTMRLLNYHPLSSEDCYGLIFEILSKKQKKAFVKHWELDFSYKMGDIARFRCNVFMQKKGLSMVCRFIPKELFTFHELGLPDTLLDLIQVKKGLVLVTGPTGSGKSTTLSSLIHYINTHFYSHIITIEDPIEFIHPNHKSLISQREVGNHTKSFAQALRSALREDPDVILIGELRDEETISLALKAAETGHLVLSTIHTSSAAKSVHRILQHFESKKQDYIRNMISDSLQGIFSQQLIPKADGQGRVPAIEILKNVPAIAHLIRENKIHQIESIIQNSKKDGMVSFRDSVIELFQKGLIAFSEVENLLPASSLAQLKSA